LRCPETERSLGAFLFPIPDYPGLGTMTQSAKVDRGVRVGIEFGFDTQ